jgi:hypothetical protein
MLRSWETFKKVNCFKSRYEKDGIKSEISMLSVDDCLWEVMFNSSAKKLSNGKQMLKLS